MRDLTVEELAATPLGFADTVLGLEGNYPWQDRAIAPLMLARGQGARRINISVVTPNGSGKDSRIIPQAAYWWVSIHRRGKVVITSKSATQLDEQTIPAIERHKHKFEGYVSIKSPRYELTTPTGGKIIAYVTDNASRVEGWHKEDDLDGPLLLIINEAATVDDEIFTGFDRCTPNCLMLLSKPGLERGRFWQSHTEQKAKYITVKAGLADCPHISQEKIDFIKSTHGENHPITRSTLYGEFMKQIDDDRIIVPWDSLNMCLENPPPKRKGFVHYFCDFADGRAENVIVKRDGNVYTIEDAWQEKNKSAVIGRFIMRFRELGAKPEQISGDAAAKDILDSLALAGWSIHRQSFGAKAIDETLYKSWSVAAWLEGAAKIERREVILPDDAKLHAQLMGRLKFINDRGQWYLERKVDMIERGLPSPDRADTLFGAMAAPDLQRFYGKERITFEKWQDEVDRQQYAGSLEELGATAGY